MTPTDWQVLAGAAQVRKVKFIPNRHDLRGDILAEFSEGHVYRFIDVPNYKLIRMLHSLDPDAYFCDNIRGVHKSEKEVQNGTEL